MTPRELAGLPLAFQSEHEVVIVKPAGLAAEAARDPVAQTVVARLRAAAASGGEFLAPPAGVWLPHRLDRPTRGFLLVALSEAAVRFHNEQVRARSWAKFYLARVALPGPSRSSGATGTSFLDALCGRHRAYLRRRGVRAEVVHAGGLPSFLSVLAAAPAPGRSGEAHLVIELLTGRYHQIRAMLANLGAPLVGDDLYGGPPGPLYLEHAVFVFRPCGAESSLRLFNPSDPAREEVAMEITAALAGCGVVGLEEER